MDAVRPYTISCSNMVTEIVCKPVVLNILGHLGCVKFRVQQYEPWKGGRSADKRATKMMFTIFWSLF